MSQSQTVEIDLVKILEKIEQKIDVVDNKVDNLTVELTTVKGDIKALSEKVDGLSKRVDSVDFINRGVFVALIIAILGGFAKIFGFIGTP